MKNAIRAGVAAVALSFMPTGAISQQQSVEHSVTPLPPIPETKRDIDGCLEGSRAVEAPINPQFPKLTARACLMDELSGVEALRANCRAKGVGVVVHDVDAPHWECALK